MTWHNIIILLRLDFNKLHEVWDQDLQSVMYYVEKNMNGTEMSLYHFLKEKNHKILGKVIWYHCIPFMQMQYRARAFIKIQD